MLTVQQSDTYTHRMSDGLETTSIIALMLQPQWLLLTRTHTHTNADTHHTHAERVKIPVFIQKNITK